MIVSFLPTFSADLNFFQFEPLNEGLLKCLCRAKAVVFPPTISPEIYFFVKNAGVPVFPEYTLRFLYPGKIGQILLFKALGLPHPETTIVPRLCGMEENPYERSLALRFPLVLKGNLGNEGSEIFLIKTEEEFKKVIKKVKAWERSGRFGFLLQEYIPTEFDARAVVIGEKVLIFFRRGGFKKNLAQGGEIIPCPKKGLKKKVYELTLEITAKTEFNLVAIDFLFKNDEPLVNEFNFVFGRRGIGERTYQHYLKKAIKSFISRALA